VVHVHNFFPLLTPSVYYACRRRIPVVQTLHNFRLICPNGMLLRQGKPCEQCVGRATAWPGVIHACYRNSYIGTAAVAAMLATHKLLGTWKADVAAYIAPLEFTRKKLIAGGLPPDRLFVKPNFLSSAPAGTRSVEDFALFVGRLSPEKGVATLISAWRAGAQNRKLKIVGQGPASSVLQDAAGGNYGIEFLGHRTRDEILNLMQRAKFLLVPSEWYEGFPLVIVEAFASGLPVIASRLGAMEEVVRDDCTGLLFNPGDSEDLLAKTNWAWDHPAEMNIMGKNARAEFEAKYTADRNYVLLMQIYDRALTGSAKRVS